MVQVAWLGSQQAMVLHHSHEVHLVAYLYSCYERDSSAGDLETLLFFFFFDDRVHVKGLY